ncbi:amino acid adenylation domain-containing protein [Streptomyces niveus]|uniref:non-ribosomal peptide synthetase n=1 Tax=Streptomyces niveus TaxID=193462 RepID=UPI0036BBD942
MTDTDRQLDLVAQFRLAVRAHPERTAVHGKDGQLTFEQLDRRTAQLAGELATRGIGRGDRVGVSLARSCGLVTALLAVWRVGAAYVPLDPQYPAERRDLMIRDSRIRMLLSDGDHGLVPPEGVKVLNPAEATSQPLAPEQTGSPLDPAYVIFTSGSTGYPKGVEATRAAVASLFSALEDSGAFGSRPTVVGWNASASFDASVAQWARVCRGDTVVVIDEERKDPAHLVALMDRHGVTELDLTPSHWELLRGWLLAPPTDGRTLRLFMGGEPVPARTWRELAEASTRGGPEALNLYGPTECTVEVAMAWITGHRPNLGYALPGNRLHVLDAHLHELPAGSEGELFIGGPQGTLGYVNRPAQTAERFIADPFGEPGTRLYRTGDRVRRTSDGTLEYLGRDDRQVKIRGFRIELGEIESVLGGCPGVASAFVVRDKGPVGQRLLAYCVLDGEGTATREDLRDYAARMLPEYMVPSWFLILDRLPLTPNGKLDTAALLKPEQEERAASVIGRGPRGEVAELIAAVWSEVLGRDGIAANSDFFALGGHSLVALRVVGRLKKNLGVVIPTKDVYRYPLLSDLATHVESLRAGSVGDSGQR